MSALNFVQDTSSYVFADVSVFLGKFKKNDLYLVSFSETDLQKMKIKNSGIAKKFRKIEIVNELKSKAIINLARRDKLPDDADIYFIDDRVEQIEDVKIKFPKIKTILLKRKEGRYKDSKNKYCNFVCYNLKQVEKIINGKYQPKRK